MSSENIKLTEIAQMSHLSVEHAIRNFKKKYGITPHQYIIESKMHIAKAMLKSTDDSVAQIASLLSFSDPHNFSAQFLKYVGERPSVFRKSHRLKNQNQQKK